MKKIIASAIGLALVGGVAATCASAVESQFGGYWRTRAYIKDDFSGSDNDTVYKTDTRTRLYYTAKFNDNFKFINKFEFNTGWGDSNGGDAGTDGAGNFLIKASYVDFDMGNTNVRIGMQVDNVGRGYWWDNDFAGIRIMPTFGNVKVPIIYATLVDEDVRGGSKPYVAGVQDETFDRHLFIIKPNFKIGDNVTLEPSFTWIDETSNDNQYFWVALDASAKFGSVSAWTVIAYNTGTTDTDGGAGNATVDNDGFMIAAGADAGIVHGQGFYFTGDDQQDNPANDSDAFIDYDGYHPWAEIMGWGMLDGGPMSNNSGGAVDYSNTWALNVGTTLKPMPKLKLDFDLWYAQLVEDRMVGGQWENDLGLEFDAKVTYDLLDDLKLEYVFAYLVAGDATGEEDPIETGIRLSLKF